MKTFYNLRMCFFNGIFLFSTIIIAQPVFPPPPQSTFVSQQILIEPSSPSEKISRWDNVPEALRNKNSFKRLEWFYRTRENEAGIFPKEEIEIQKKLEMTKINGIIQKGNKLQLTSDQWTSIGPKAIDMSSSFIPHWGKVSGRVKGVAVHPTNPNIVYIGAAAGGIWKTENGGNNWSDMSGDLNLLTFGAIAIDPNNPNTVYAGTGEAMAGLNNVTFEGDGLYKSTDGGISWTKITNGFGVQTQFSDIVVSPHNSNIILASIGSGNWNNSAPTNEGVWRSSDAGITWTRVVNLGDAFDVAFHPTDVNKAYAGIGGKNASGGFLVSNDAGINWTQSNTGLPAPNTITRIQFSVSPSLSSTIYALLYNNVAFSSGHNTVVFKSTDSGLNWSQISSGVLISGTYNGSTISDQGSYDLCLDVNPTNVDNVFFGNVELSKTIDGATISFVRKTPSTFANPGAWDAPIHVDIHKIAFAPSNPNIIYIGCDGGIYKSIDGGLNFTDINNNLNTVQFYNIASDPNNENILYGGAQDNGNFSTSNKGATDWEFETSGDGMHCFVDYNNSNNIFMSTQVGNLLKSSDGGINWVQADNYYNSAAWNAPYWQHPTTSTTIYAAINGRLRRSTASGALTTWSFLSGLISGYHISSVAQSPITPDNLIAISSYYKSDPPIHKSIDGGFSWTDITSNLLASFTHKSINKVVASPTDANTFYLCRVSYNDGQVLKTTDFGATWIDISGNLPKISHNDLFVDPLNTNHLYVANDFGVYWTNNGGNDWHKLSNGMPFVPVLDFDFYENGSKRLLRAASHGRGIFEMQIDSPLEKVYVDLRVFLEGAYDNQNMNSNITIPSAQPFNTAPWNYSETITANIGNDIVDWVLVELRTGASPATATTIIKQKAGLLKNDGTIVDADGFTNLNFDVAAGDYYIVIYHRNHLPIMSPTTITIE
ncbi:MAG: hypothetical protein IPK06_11840 [Ignavibacteriae bacterium]|nr:hypothetical protein [Ignavibacteriota bacterium]